MTARTSLSRANATTPTTATIPGENDPRCVYYYDFDAAAKKWTRHLMHEGGTVGFGINTEAVDIDADGDVDVVAPGKSGLYLFENLLK